MKRKIIKINQEKCTGCGLCIPDCPEGAIQLIDGKARLISDLFCDGLGACIGTCPENAITVVEREAEEYDEIKVMENIIKQGDNVINAHLQHLKEHNQTEYLQQAIEFLKKNGYENPENMLKSSQQTNSKGCPGTKVMNIDTNKENLSTKGKNTNMQSKLTNWPIQLKLINTDAPLFDETKLVIAADCTAFSYANFHNEFLKSKKLIMFCPKLDENTNLYVDKLAQIFSKHHIKSISLLHMQVPCCFGTISIVEDAMKKAEKDIPVFRYKIGINGEIMEKEEMNLGVMI